MPTALPGDACKQTHLFAHCKYLCTNNTSCWHANAAEAWSVVKGNFPPRSLSSLRELRDALVGYSTDYPVRERSTSRCWGLRLLLLLGGSSIAFQSQLSLSLSSYKRRDEGIHWIYGWNPNRNLRSECSSWVLLCVGSRIYICVGARMYICSSA